MKVMRWAITDPEGNPMFDTLSTSADAAIETVATRLKAKAFEELLRRGFRLERVSVEVVVVKQGIER